MSATEPSGTPEHDRCRRCGSEADAQARFCPGCGVAIDRGPAGDGAGGNPTTGDRVPSGDVVDRDPGSITTSPAGSEGGLRTAAVARAAALEGVGCPACGADNAPDREICGACGVDLATGETGLTAAALPVPTQVVATARPDASSRRWRWWMPLLAALVVVAGVAGALMLLEVGPFASAPEVPEASYEASHYPDPPGPLALTDVATLTVRAPEGERTFTPDHLVDGDPTTSWHGERDDLPAGTDEKVDLFLEEPAWVHGVILANGDHADAGAYADSARLQRAELVFDGDAQVGATLLDQGLEAQIVEFSEPLLSTAVRIEVLETFEGLERPDVALSRVELLGVPADDEDAALARERADTLPAAGAIRLPS